jgi:ankyrin repeat protein
MNKEFFDAIRQNDLGKVERLLVAYPDLVYEKNEGGLSPVMVAAHYRQAEVLEFLSEKTGSLNIFEASATGRTHQVLRHIARDPLLIGSCDSNGFTPLGLACFFGHCETAEHLIKMGAVVNAPTHSTDGSAPIHLATRAGHAEIVLLLIKNNANPNVREINGSTPLHIASQNGDTKIIRTLLFNGADMTIRNHKEKLAIDLAVEANQTDAVKLLKEGITRRFKPFRPSPSQN